jgi:hypothetical protein
MSLFIQLRFLNRIEYTQSNVRMADDYEFERSGTISSGRFYFKKLSRYST